MHPDGSENPGGVGAARPRVAAGEGGNPVKLRRGAKKMELLLVFFGHTHRGKGSR